MLSFLTSRLFRFLLQWPKMLLVFSLALSVFLWGPIRDLKWDLTVTSLMNPEHPSSKATREFEANFGGMGTLELLLSSQDSSTTLSATKQLHDFLGAQNDVSWAEYQTQADFYREYRLLYVKLKDLQAIHDRIEMRLDAVLVEHNPFVVDLLEDAIPSGNTDSLPPLNLSDIEQKYLNDLHDFQGQKDGKMVILTVYPRFSASDYSSSRHLVQKVENWVHQFHQQYPDLKVEMAGRIYENAVRGEVLLREIFRLGWITAGIAILFLFLWFLRQPHIPLLAAIPIGLSMWWTLGFAGLVGGSMNLFTLLLGLLLPGLGGGLMAFVLTRYAEERRRGLGPELAVESVVLGSGPVITLISLLCISAFLSLYAVPLTGFRRLGLLGAVGTTAIWLTTLLVFPALLIVLQKRRTFRIFGPRVRKLKNYSPRQFHRWKILLPVLLLVSLIAVSRGFYPRFDYDFEKTEYTPKAQKIRHKLESLGHPIYDPVVFTSHSLEESNELTEALLELRREHPNLIGQIVSPSSVLPRDQDKKILLLQQIRNMLRPEVIQRLQGQDLENIRKVEQYWNVKPLSVADLPDSYIHKFLGKTLKPCFFTFVFPAVDIDFGSNCRQVARVLRVVDHHAGAGTAILRADLLDLTLPWMHRSLWITIAVSFFLILLFQNRFYQTLLIMLPSAIGFVWALAILRLFHISLNTYSAVIFPVLIAISLVGPCALWQSYREESTGSLHYVMRRTGIVVAGYTFIIVISFTSLLFSSHLGLRSIGQVTVITLLTLLVAQLSWFPLLVGWLDSKRWQNTLSSLKKS